MFSSEAVTLLPAILALTGFFFNIQILHELTVPSVRLRRHLLTRQLGARARVGNIQVMKAITPNASYIALACVYAALAFACLVQLARAQLRQPRCTTQKLFHAAISACAAMRAGTFASHHTLSHTSVVVRMLAMDVPSLVFCSAFGALAWFWSDVYHNAKRERREGRRAFIIYVVVNVAMYLFACVCVVALARGKVSDAVAESWSLRGTALAASYVASMFAVYGVLLIIMLRRFPNESEGRARKIWEVAVVASASFGAFVTRAVRDAADAQRSSGGAQSAYDLTHASAVRHVIYYSSTEIIVAICVLYVLRKLPPARGTYDDEDDEDIEQPFTADYDDDNSDDSDSSD